MTIGDLINIFDGTTNILVQMETINPFEHSEVIYNHLYCGEIKDIDRVSISSYMEKSIKEAKLCVDEGGHPFISALMEGLVR